MPPTQVVESRRLWRKNDGDNRFPLCSEHILKYGREMSRITVTLPSSDLSRNPAKVFSVAEKTPVGVTRRDGENLVLMSEREDHARTELLQLAAELIAVAVDDQGTLVERMAHRFSWMLALSETDQAACTKDLVRSARASFSTGGAHLVLDTLQSWRATAEAFAQGLEATPTQWLTTPERVERPA
jgi:PHD/YefM family antitoxin component YafN of YafNO toxin-antitoxin module